MSAFRIVISAAMVCCTVDAVAQQSAEAVPRATFIATMDAEFKSMDLDKNGLVTKKEIEGFQRSAAGAIAKQRSVALFQALDVDKNGQISAAEFGSLPMNVPQPNGAPVLAQVDGNRDGQATLIEYRAGKLVNFDQIDRDKDGVVSVAEMKAAGVIK